MASEFPSLTRDARMPLPYASDHDDEISLIDLWIILVRRKWVVAGVLLLCVLLGLGWVLVKPPGYQYETTIQIGEVFSGDTLQPIEPVTSVLAKIQETYIPLARTQHLSGGTLGGFKLEARSPQGSALIVVSGEGSAAQQSTYLELLHDVFQQIQTDLSPRFKAARQATERERESAETRLQQLMAEAKLSQGQLERLDSWTQTVEQRLQAVRADLQALREQRNGLLKRDSADSADMRLIVLNGDIRTLQDMVADLQEQLGKWIPAQRDEILSRLKQNQVDQSTQRLHMQEIETRAAALQPTRAVLAPQRLPEPIGTGPVVILALAGVLGLMLGVFAAFFTEFLTRANAVMKSSTER
ncbi:MAG: hypothetical protein J5I81_09350 [Nitrococcus mobilis]|nr:hypothetical protein [Nitrococcus mobilis]